MIGTMCSLDFYFTMYVYIGMVCMKSTSLALRSAAPAFNLNCGITHRTTRKHTEASSHTSWCQAPLVRHSLNFSSSIYSSWRCRFSFIACMSSNVYFRLKYWDRWNTHSHTYIVILNPTDRQISQSIRDARDLFDVSFLLSAHTSSRFMPSSSALQIRLTAISPKPWADAEKIR